MLDILTLVRRAIVVASLLAIAVLLIGMVQS
jgi:hypothetical protein